MTDATAQRQRTTLQRQINSSWNETAAKARGEPHHAVRDEEERRLWHDVLRALLPLPPADVLDIGIGTGQAVCRADRVYCGHHHAR